MKKKSQRPLKRTKRNRKIAEVPRQAAAPLPIASPTPEPKPPSAAPPYVPHHIPPGRVLRPLPPLEAYPPWRSMSQTCRYLDLSLPTVYRMCKRGELESYGVGGRRRVTTRSIEWHFLPPNERKPLPTKKVEFEALSTPPVRWPGSQMTLVRAEPKRRSA